MDLNHAFHRWTQGDGSALSVLQPLLEKWAAPMSWPDDDARQVAIDTVLTRLWNSKTTYLRRLRSARATACAVLVARAAKRGATRDEIEAALLRPLTEHEASQVHALDSVTAYLRTCLRSGQIDAFRKASRQAAPPRASTQDDHRGQLLLDRIEHATRVLNESVLPALHQSLTTPADHRRYADLEELRRSVADGTSAAELARRDQPDRSPADMKRAEDSRSKRWSRARKWLESWLEEDYRGGADFRKLYPFVLLALDETYRFRQTAVRKTMHARLLTMMGDRT